jgi:hypothetical protein
MIERIPPKLALWLLKAWGSPYHRESLAGDLIEQYQEGRSKAWCWKQVAVAVLVARGQFIRAWPWFATGRVPSRLLAEIAAVLALAVGTLAWADTLRGDAHQSPACVCPHDRAASK